MAEKFNTARRVRNIVFTAKGQPTGATTLAAWGSTFQTLDLPNAQFETYRLLEMLTNQVDSLAREVEGFGLDQSDYQVTFSNLNSILMVTNLDTQWQNYQRYITDVVIRQLGIFAQMSQIDEPVVPLEDFGQLKQDLLDFRDQVIGSAIDDRLKAFVLQQIETILRAIREYPIRGVEAIKDGDKAVVATALSEHELLQEHKGEEVVEKTATFWDRLRKFAPKVVINLDPTRMLTDVDPQKMLEAGSDVIDKL